jgi:hypothetical protein
MKNNSRGVVKKSRGRAGRRQIIKKIIKLLICINLIIKKSGYRWYCKGFYPFLQEGGDYPGIPRECGLTKYKNRLPLSGSMEIVYIIDIVG